MNLMTFLSNHFEVLLIKLWQQIYLAIAATMIAIVIGFPIGLWIANKHKVKNIILGIASILQTVPSLALLAILLPFLGIGFKPAIIALSIYAILPVLRNTTIGIEEVNKNIIEAADGLGFTTIQKLWRVEIPLALPTIIGGIRTATAMSVGIATIATFIGAGGLGDFISQGLSMNNQRLILLGAIPAAGLALGLDFILGLIEKKLTRRKKSINPSRRYQLMIPALLLITIAAFMGIKEAKIFSHHDGNGTIVVGTKSFTEQYILGQMIVQLLRAKTHLHVITKFNLGSTSVCQSALLKGEIDLYPEYTGTAYITILHENKIRSEQQVYDIVKHDYLKKFNLVWLPPFGFNNTQSLIVRKNFARKFHLTNISDLIPIEKTLHIAAPPAFLQRADSYKTLHQTYGITFASINQMDIGLLYKALHNEKVNIILGFSTDGRIMAYHLQILKDNKHAFPPYYAAIIIRKQTLEKFPQIRTALKPLYGLLTDKSMRQLNYEVNIGKETPFAAAHAFLVSKGLISS